MQKSIWFALICILFSFSLFAQSNDIPAKIKKGVIKTNEGFSIKFQDLRHMDGTIIYKEAGKVTDEKMLLSNIYQIEEEKGNYGGLGAGIGAAAGLIGGALNVSRLKDENDQLRNAGFIVEELSASTIIIGFTAIGTLTGFLSTVFIKKEETVYTAPQTGKPTSYLQWKAGTFNGKAGLQLTYNF